VRNCFRRTRILEVSPYLDPQEECQPIGNRSCTSWHRSIFYEWEWDSGHRICNEHRIEREPSMNGIQKEPSMNAVQVEQKSYEMPPREGSASRIFSPSHHSR
jgi:hypothetical protein